MNSESLFEGLIVYSPKERGIGFCSSRPRSIPGSSLKLREIIIRYIMIAIFCRQQFSDDEKNISGDLRSSVERETQLVKEQHDLFVDSNSVNGKG